MLANAPGPRDAAQDQLTDAPWPAVRTRWFRATGQGASVSWFRATGPAARHGLPAQG
jgi:hypothetical protein